MRRAVASLLALTVAASAVQAAAAPAADAAAAPAFQPSGAQCRGTEGYAADFGGRRTFLWRPAWLEATKARAVTDPALRPAYEALIAAADQALARGPYTVVDKRKVPASGDKHDYYSIGPYWWPDPAKPDGPYVRRDGEKNPERDTDAFDTADLEAMSSDVEALALAYYFTGERRYAEHAAKLLKVWFVEPATRMNPNLDHAQSVPGRVPGRAEGVIDAFRLVRVVEGIGLLGPSEALSAEDDAAIQAWFGDLVKWMANSKLGQEERAAANNHGIYYDLLLTEFALYAGYEDAAKTVVAQFPRRRILPQMAADGGLPHELTRTRSFHYSNWTLVAAYDIAALGECVGLDLWRFEAADGRGLKRGTDFLAAYAGREAAWPHPELHQETELYYEILQRAAWAWGDPAYAAKAAGYGAKHQGLRVNLRLPPYRGG